MDRRCRAVLVIVGGVLVHLTLGTLYTFGNLSPYLTSYIRKHSSPSDVTYGDSVWIYAMAGMGQGMTMFIGGILEKRLGARLTVLVGAWFQSLGILLTYFAIKYSLWATIVTYGLMFGFGVGVAYAVPLAVGMRWLPNRKGLVNGCVVAGFGGGAFIFDQIQTAFINPHNEAPEQEVDGDKYFTQEDILEKVPTIFLILGGTYAVMQLIGCILLCNPPGFQIEQRVEKDVDIGSTTSDTEKLLPNTQDENCAENPSTRDPSDERAMTPKDLLKHSGFYNLWFIFLLNGQGVIFISSLYKAYGQTFISDDVFLAGVGAFAAVCNAAGRIMWGTLADRFSFKVAMMCLCCMFTVLMLTLPVTSIAGRWMFILWVGLLFLAFSGNFSLLPTATARSFGQAHVTRNYGLVFTSQVITNPIGAVLTASLRTAVGWNGMFFLVAGCSFTSFVLAIVFNVKMNDGREV